MTQITHIEDLRRLARKRVPRMFYDYADSGSWSESTYRANEADFQPIKFRQRVAVNMEGRSTRTTMVGQEVALPVALAPTGLTGMQHADGEILAARAARNFGVPFTLSTFSSVEIYRLYCSSRLGRRVQIVMISDVLIRKLFSSVIPIQGFRRKVSPTISSRITGYGTTAIGLSIQTIPFASSPRIVAMTRSPFLNLSTFGVSICRDPHKFVFETFFII